MELTEQLKQYTKFWNEFVEWMETTHQWELVDGAFWYLGSRYISHRELTSLLVEFLDSKGYYVEVRSKITNVGVRWDWMVWSNLTVEVCNDNFIHTRQQGTEAGILKAVELYETNIKNSHSV